MEARQELARQLSHPPHPDAGAGYPYALKKSFRRLMRKHHPDLQAAHPERQRAATELTKKLTGAYQEIEKHLQGKKAPRTP